VLGFYVAFLCGGSVFKSLCLRIGKTMLGKSPIISSIVCTVPFRQQRPVLLCTCDTCPSVIVRFLLGCKIRNQNDQQRSSEGKLCLEYMGSNTPFSLTRAICCRCSDHSLLAIEGLNVRASLLLSANSLLINVCDSVLGWDNFPPDVSSLNLA
jgi:hypothetical protein